MSSLAQWLQSQPPTEIHNSLGGLFPRTWVCAGAAFSREELKAQLLSRLGGISSRVVVTPQELVLSLLPSTPRREMASLAARREVIDRLWAQPRILAQMEKLKRMRRRPDAVARLEQALSQGRLAFVGMDDFQSFEETLSQSGTGQARRELREELFQFSVAYEAVLQECGWLDYPLALQHGIEFLQSGAPLPAHWPETVLWCDVRKRGEPREELFWSLLGERVRWVRLNGGNQSDETDEAAEVQPPTEERSEIWHTWDDVASAAVDRWLADPGLCVVIPPAPWDRVARRSLLRAVHARGAYLEDERDPLYARRSEQVRRALLPLQIVARGLRREDLIEWLQGRQDSLSPSCVRLTERGWVQSRNKEDTEELLSWLEPEERRTLRQWLDAARGKHSLAHWREIFFSSFEGLGVSAPHEEVRVFLKRVWDEWVQDAQRLGDGARQVRALWIERGIRTRVEQTSGPAPRLRDAGGLELYRLGQVPPDSLSERRSGILFLGIQPEIFAARITDRSIDDLWWNIRERERLAGVTGVRCRKDVLRERKQIAALWRTQFSGKSCWDLQIAWDRSGAELETWPGRKCGGHSETVAAYSALQLLPKRQVQLEPTAIEHYSASMIEEWSRCPFRALVRHRWKLKDFRDADPEGWVEEVGSLLHEAVRLGMQARREGRPLSAGEQLEAAWKRRAPRGLERSPLRRAQLLHKCERILVRFWEDEALWMAQPWTEKVQDLANDDMELRLELPSGVVVGKPDRIMDTPWGIWIQDYKTSSASQLPTGQKMLAQGYRLQLPFYALAARKRFAREVAGVQFVSLTLQGDRKRGVFFKKWNGKDSTHLTQMHASNRSLMPGEPEVVWAEFSQKIDSVIQGWNAANFLASPRNSTECDRCNARAICGQNRSEVLGGVEKEGGTE